MVWLIFVAFVVTVYLIWDRAAEKLKRDGRGWLFRHWIATVLAGSIGIIQATLMYGEFGISTVVGWVIFGAVVWLSRQPIPVPVDEVKTATSQVNAVSERRGGNAIALGEKLDVVRFDYANAKGEFSSRRVRVTMAGQWQFEGIDLDKDEERTFRYDRVIGPITSEVTGEVLESTMWADAMLKQHA